MQLRAGAAYVGRARELGEVERVLGATRAGRGSVVLVSGEAGIGKTRLATELAGRARAAGFEVLIGRSIDVVGADLSYQPFVDALRPLEQPWDAGGSRLRVFEEVLASLAARAAVAPVLLVLEDLHWADASTIDLIVFLAHNLERRRVLVLATYRADEPASAERVRRLADGVRRSGTGVVLELEPLSVLEVVELVAARAETPPPAAVTEAVVSRSEGNPLFAEELLAAADDDVQPTVPRGLRDLLLRRVAGLTAETRGLLRLAAASGRDVSYRLLEAVGELDERALHASLREAVEAGVLIAEPSTGGFRFRHALLAEAVYATVLPGEREHLHARLADELARSGAASPAELAPHWAAAGRSAAALAASVEAARQAEAVHGLAEACAHLERALALWAAVPDAPTLVGLDLAELCTWTAERASQVGAAGRAVELGRRAVELAGGRDQDRAALLHVRLGEYLYAVGDDALALAAFERAVAIGPADAASPERAFALGSLAGGLMVAWRYADSLPVAEQALALARRVGAGEAEVRALTVLGGDLAYLGADDGLDRFGEALELAERIGDLVGVDRAYVNLSDALMMLGQPCASARVAQDGLDAMRRYGIDNPLLAANRIEALVALGDWDEAERSSAAALRGIGSSFPYPLLIARASLEVGRGLLDDARAHLEAARATLPDDRVFVGYHSCAAELALEERRWADVEAIVEAGLRRTSRPEAALLRVQLCATGLRGQADLAALARARRDDEALRVRQERARALLDGARQAAAAAEPVTPNASGWLALAEAEHERASGPARPDAWAAAASTGARLERPPLAAYCRWREAEALVAAGASRAAAGEPLRAAHAVATRLGAAPLVRELELLAQRGRLDLAPAPVAGDVGGEGVAESLGLTAREAEVLALVARGYTNREIAATLVISVKTASLHVSHILAKLGAPNRREAAAIAHRLAPRAGG